MFGTIKPYIPWLLVSLFSLVLILSNENPQVTAIRGNFSDLVVIGSHPISNFLKAPGIWKENRHLRDLLADMSLRLARYSNSMEESIRYRKMLEFKQRTEYKLIAGEVIGLNPDIGIRSILINIGAKDSVELNQAVITPEGVVGRIYRVAPNSSAVQLMLDPNFGAAGRLKRIHEDGIIHASGLNRLKLDGITVNSIVVEGDTVITSGLDAIFPEGLLVGCVCEIRSDPGGWLWEIEIEPALDFGKLSEVFVVRRDEQPVQ